MDRMAIKKSENQESEALRHKPGPDIIAENSSGLTVRAVSDVQQRRTLGSGELLMPP
jgi:hypothetical protein